MALNFPPVDTNDGNPTDGMIWTSPSGAQWMYQASVPGWTALSPTGNSNIIYRGGLDLTQDPSTQYNDIVSGNQFAVTVGANPVNGTLYPGLGGQNIIAGTVVMYDGNEWQVVAFNSAYATETVPGIIQIATSAEAIAGTNDTKAMTPAKVQEAIPDASTTVAGIAEYATVAEAEAGVLTDRTLTPASIANLISTINDLVANQVPTGAVQYVVTQTAPTGWIKCDGARIYRTGDYVDLYDLLLNQGNIWGAGSATAIYVPDLRGRFIRGYADGTGRDPYYSGFGEYVNDNFAAHNHTVNDPGHFHNIDGNNQASGVANQDRIVMDNNVNLNTAGQVQLPALIASTNIYLSNAGGLETAPKHVPLTPIIKL